MVNVPAPFRAGFAVSGRFRLKVRFQSRGISR